MKALLDLDDAIAQEIITIGQTRHNEIASKDEVTRLQDSIEIW